MPSLRARLVNLALPLLGAKRFFSEPERMRGRIAKMRQQPSPRPHKKWHDRFEISEFASRGYPVVTIQPKGGAKPGAPHLLYLHGGGYVMDIAPIHWNTVFKLCEQLGASATVPVYPLAPESTAVEVLPQMLALYDELEQQHGADNITVMGDSAGGGMALALAQAVKAAGGAMPSALVLYSPWLDAAGTGEGQAEIEPRDRILSLSGLHECGRLYAGELPVEDPRVSPLYGELEGLPPTAIFAGTCDILLPDARRLRDRMGGEHLYREYPDMFHVWALFPVPEGRQALSETVDFIRQKSKSPT